MLPSPEAPAPIPSALGLSLYATAHPSINAPLNPGNRVLPITNIRENQPVGLREKPHAVVEDGTRPSGLRLEWSTRPEWDDWAALSEGCYVLRTNIADWSPEDLWRTYIQLTEAEAAFRVNKTELSIRPVWHQRKERVQAHILVCFLAYVLWKTLEQWQKRAGLGNSPRTILDELARITSADVVMPTTDGRELRIRCVVRPDSSQSQLLARLGLRLPERLRPTPPILKM